ncbi:ribosomal-processing cysteine protease Prp [Aquibacillus salsiterrae]|uniref:Ribosomal processing cysteine protease Prp n=1 Tax=Aquibacillus salsiterrae TaxID=2950439 RepID=A0A9X3WB12_9BACI|nr:ribosomal-processing cysteine protease Prp [Aquibacillus salsiterrae]MDC3415662.1 ribosomal-processing cysteine protease Prp [Aquibacillus salsiterrae]
MIRVTAYRNGGNIFAFELSGHAESVSEGYDLVCAGVSAVSFGSVNAVIKLCGIEPVITQAGSKGGYLKVELPENLTDEVRTNAQLLLEGMIVSLETIERDYGQYISIFNK